MSFIKRNAKVILGVVLIIIVQWYGLREYYKNYYNTIPKVAPTLEIIYENKKIPLENGDYNWFEKGMGGSSNIFGDPIETLKNYKPIDVNSGGTLQYTYLKNPPNVVLVTIKKWNNSKWENLDKYFTFHSTENFMETISLPKEKGIYIYEVDGVWDGTHTTAHVFKISVN